MPATTANAANTSQAFMAAFLHVLARNPAVQENPVRPRARVRNVASGFHCCNAASNIVYRNHNCRSLPGPLRAREETHPAVESYLPAFGSPKTKTVLPKIGRASCRERRERHGRK